MLIIIVIIIIIIIIIIMKVKQKTVCVGVYLLRYGAPVFLFASCSHESAIT